MAEKMKAFVMHKIGEVGIIEKPVPQDPGPNGAIVKTTHALVCTSDTHTVKGALGERDTWRTHQDRLIAEVVQPVFDAWLEAALLAGAIKANGTPFKLGSRALLEPVTWTPRRWQWVDPVKETAANVSAIQAGLKSPSEVVAEQGRGFEEVVEEIRRDREILRAAGVDPFGGER